jgi:hypothetical protein
VPQEKFGRVVAKKKVLGAIAVAHLCDEMVVAASEAAVEAYLEHSEKWLGVPFVVMVSQEGSHSESYFSVYLRMAHIVATV